MVPGSVPEDAKEDETWRAEQLGAGGREARSTAAGRCGRPPRQRTREL